MTSGTPGSPVPPPMIPGDVWSDDDNDETVKTGEMEQWMQKRIEKGDITRIPIPKLAAFMASVLEARSPTGPDFVNYVDTFEKFFNVECAQRAPSQFEDLEGVRQKQEDEQELKQDKSYYDPEFGDDGFIVDDLNEFPKKKPENYDSDFESEDDNYVPSGDDSDEFDSDFDDSEEEDFEPTLKKSRKDDKKGGGTYLLQV